jgi:hypothetical protein
MTILIVLKINNSKIEENLSLQTIDQIILVKMHIKIIYQDISKNQINIEFVNKIN